MKEWSTSADQKILELTHTDSDYQDILQQVREKEVDYQRILATLSSEDALVVDDYIALCEELLYQKVRLAYIAGTSQQKTHR